MLDDWLNTFSGSSIADGLTSAFIAIPLIWGIARLIRVVLRRAKSFSSKHLETARVAVGRYAASDGFAKLTFQNYLKGELEKSKSEMTFCGSVLVAIVAALPTASKNAPLAAFAILLFVVFAGRLVSSLGKHVRNQMIEEAIFDPLSIENTQALMAEHAAAEIKHPNA